LYRKANTFENKKITPPRLGKGVKFSSKAISRVLSGSIINLALPLLTGSSNLPILATAETIQKRAASFPGPIWSFNS